jgi:hypothetical protein
MMVATLGAALIALSMATNHPMPHGEGVLTSSRATVSAGERLDLRGASFAPGESFTVKLVGVLQEFTLATAIPAADSTFALSVEIPTDAGEGTYRVDVVAPDGDVSGSVDLTISAAASASPAMARADDVPIQRETTGVGWAVIGVLIGLAAGFGIGLLTANRTGSHVG